MNTEHKFELPADVREAIIKTIYHPGFWQRREPVTELCAALAPLWPKRPAPTSDAQQVAKRICDLAEIVSQDGGEWIALDVEKVAAVLAGYTNQPPAPSDAEILSGYWKARAEKAEAKANVVAIPEDGVAEDKWMRIGPAQAAVLLAERDQLRAQLSEAQNIIRHAENHNEAGRAAIDAARAKEDTRHD